MSIVKVVKRENPYTQIDNRCIEDKRLSFKARGILVYLLSKPSDWTVRVKDLCNKTAEKPTAVKSGLKELVRVGYAKIIQERAAGGKMTGSYYQISETPDVISEITDLANSRSSVSPTLGKTRPLVRTDINSNTHPLVNEKKGKEGSFFSPSEFSADAISLANSIIKISCVAKNNVPKLNYIKKFVRDYETKGETIQYIAQLAAYCKYIERTKQFIPNDPVKLIKLVRDTDWSAAYKRLDADINSYKPEDKSRLSGPDKAYWEMIEKLKGERRA